MKKIFKVTLLVIVMATLLVSSFLLGAYASNDWKTSVVIKANEDIGKAGYDTKEELLNNLDSMIETRIYAEVDPSIKARQDYVKGALEGYFDEKVLELIGSDEFNQLENEFDIISEQVINRYKATLDTAFKNKR